MAAALPKRSLLLALLLSSTRSQTPLLQIVDPAPCSAHRIPVTSTASYSTDIASALILGSTGSAISQVTFSAALGANPPSALSASLWSDDPSATMFAKPLAKLFSADPLVATGGYASTTQLSAAFSTAQFPPFTRIWLVVTSAVNLPFTPELCAVPVPPTGYTVEQPAATFSGVAHLAQTSGGGGGWSLAPSNQVAFAALGRAGSATPSPTPTPTPTPTGSVAATPSASESPTPTLSATAPPSGSSSATGTPSPTAPATGAASPTASPTASPSPTASSTPTPGGASPTPSPSCTRSATLGGPGGAAASPQGLSPGGAAALSLSLLLLAFLALLCLHQPSLAYALLGCVRCWQLCRWRPAPPSRRRPASKRLGSVRLALAASPGPAGAQAGRADSVEGGINPVELARGRGMAV